LKNFVFVLFLITFLLSGKAYAYTLDNQYLSDQIKKSVEKQVNSVIPGRIIVDVKSIPYQSIKVPDGKLKIKTSVSIRYFTPNILAKVEIIAGDKKVTEFGVPVKLQVWDKVWVANDTINRGETLSSSNIVLKEKEISYMTDKVVKESTSLEGNLVKKSFIPGEVIDMRYIESIPTIMKNSQVSLIFKTQLITISLAGEALDNGKTGDYIRVRNKNYKKDYIGKVIGENTVLINL